MGRYLPRKVVQSSDLEGRLGLDDGWILSHQGVKERRWAEGEETNSFMGARAVKDALARAELGVEDVDLLINASGTSEQYIPDTGALIQRALGWGRSGIPAFTVHATCLSFIAGLDVATSMIRAGRYKTVVVVTSEVTSCGLDWSHPENSTLFGDVAVAAVISATPDGESSGVEAMRFETYGDGSHLTQVPGGGTRLPPNDPDTRPEDNMFHMDGPGVMRMVSEIAGPFLERVRPGLSQGLGDIDWVVPHQASKLGVESLQFFGMPAEKIVKTLDRFGNCVGGSIPNTLFEAIDSGRLKRGQRVLLVGSGAGLSLGAAILVY